MMAVAVVEENWQTKCRGVLERVAFLWNNELLSDVKFVVPAVSNGESETKVIPAHKFVLGISSPVFYATFYGQMAETSDSIELPDCEHESLLELFRFFYSDEVKLTGSNVMHVLYLAKKYMVPSLADKCTEFLRNNLQASNVFSILPHAEKFEDKDLEDRCWKVIEMQTEEAVTSDEFAMLERSLVESVVKRERLNVKEIELFKAVNRWATKECKRQGITLDGKVKREILGEEIVTAIRFPLMSQKEFISVVPDCNILTEKEIVDLIKHSNDVLTSPLQFSVTPRVKVGAILEECRRFDTFKIGDRIRWRYQLGKSDRLCITASKDIFLCGVKHFGFEACSHTVNVGIYDTTNGSCIAEKSGSYRSEIMYQDANEYYGFAVMFDNPVCLKPNNYYEMVSLIQGPPSLYGMNGTETVEFFGVVIGFRDTDRLDDSNGTCISSGQIPALLFSFSEVVQT